MGERGGFLRGFDMRGASIGQHEPYVLEEVARKSRHEAVVAGQRPDHPHVASNT